MHEYSLVRSLLSQVCELAASHGASCVETIRVEIGPLSGVEPVLLQTAFEILAPGASILADSLQIEEVPLEARCTSCEHVFEVQNFRFHCPSCGNEDVSVIRGDAFKLLDITIQKPSTEGGCEE